MEDENAFPSTLHPQLCDFLEKNNFSHTLEEIKSNVASPEAFRQRFLRKFNLFWILKYLHYAEGNGIKKVEVREAASILQLIIKETEGSHQNSSG